MNPDAPVMKMFMCRILYPLWLAQQTQLRHSYASSGKSGRARRFGIYRIAVVDPGSPLRCVRDDELILRLENFQHVFQFNDHLVNELFELGVIFFLVIT